MTGLEGAWLSPNFWGAVILVHPWMDTTETCPTPSQGNISSSANEGPLLTQRDHKLKDIAGGMLAEKGYHCPQAQWSPQDNRDALHTDDEVVFTTEGREGHWCQCASPTLCPTAFPNSPLPQTNVGDTYMIYRLSPLAYSFPEENKQ